MTEQADLIQLDSHRILATSEHPCLQLPSQETNLAFASKVLLGRRSCAPPTCGRESPRHLCEQHVTAKKTAGITTQLPSAPGSEARHFDASDSNRQAQKRHPVANQHSGSARQTCIGWSI